MSVFGAVVVAVAVAIASVYRSFKSVLLFSFVFVHGQSPWKALDLVTEAMRALVRTFNFGSGTKGLPCWQLRKLYFSDMPVWS